MKVYTEEVPCATCGGTGLARPRDAARQWLGVEFVHVDPATCAAALRRQRAELEAQRVRPKEAK